MKAVYFESHGGNEVLQLGERPDPQPGRGEVVVRIRAAALNHLDLFVRDGLPNVPIELPHIPGSDGAGIVESAGEAVEDFRTGDRVLIQPGLYCNACEFCRAGEQSLCVKFKLLGEHVPGTFAERVALPSRNVFRIPDSMSFEEAASFPLAYQTAWRMLVGRAALRPGETVLIHGIGGGVAWAALEIAILSGARVFVTSSEEGKLEAARAAGAEEAWNYRAEDVRKAVSAATRKRGCDVVVDTVGDSTWMISLRSVARGGRIVTCGATSGPNPKEEIRLIFWNQISILGSTMANDREFRSLLSAVFAGRLRPRVDSVFPVASVRGAFEKLESGWQHGKIVVAL
ncbi:MAG: zinc-binding dehydrogenase [Thermoanaerobaculia bacterium]